MIELLPENSKRDQDELNLLITLGPAYIATMGYTAFEVEDVYNRAYKLCRDMKDVEPRFTVLSGLRRFYIVSGDFRTTREIGEELLALAQSQPDPVLLLDAYWSMSNLLFQLGELTLVQQYLDEAVAIFEPHQDSSQMMRHGTIPGVHCLGWLSLTLWMRGYPDQALQRAQEALTIVRQYTSIFALWFALFQIGTLHTYRREMAPIQKYLKEIQEIRAGQADSWSISLLQGWMLLAQGRVAEGISCVRGMLDKSENLAYSPYVVALLAESYLQASQFEAGINAIAEGFTRIEKMGSHNYEAELYRLKGRLLLHKSPDNATEAESCYQNALEISRRQEAKSLELRAATSLARLWKFQTKHQEAYDLLARVYGWFTEGFDTADLIDARVLLDELESQ